MRDIKFRGKSLITGEWVYGSLVTNGDKAFIVEPFGEEAMFGNGINLGELIWHQVDVETVGQYTEQNDDNNNEIFQSDVLELVDFKLKVKYRALVKWRAAKGYWMLVNNEGRFIDFLYKAELVEIIGNIHDHPELLESEGNA